VNGIALQYVGIGSSILGALLIFISCIPQLWYPGFFMGLATLGIAMMFIIWGDTKELNKKDHIMSVLRLSSGRDTLSKGELPEVKRKRYIEKGAYITFLIAIGVVSLFWAIRMASVISRDLEINAIDFAGVFPTECPEYASPDGCTRIVTNEEATSCTRYEDTLT
jgi:hypothetical protein